MKRELGFTVVKSILLASFLVAATISMASADAEILARTEDGWRLIRDTNENTSCSMSKMFGGGSGFTVLRKYNQQIVFVLATPLPATTDEKLQTSLVVLGKDNKNLSVPVNTFYKKGPIVNLIFMAIDWPKMKSIFFAGDKLLVKIGASSTASYPHIIDSPEFKFEIDLTDFKGKIKLINDCYSKFNK